MPLDQLSRLHPTITFAHAAPGFVSSSWGTELNRMSFAVFPDGFLTYFPLAVLRGVVRVLQVFAKSSLQCATDLGPALTGILPSL